MLKMISANNAEAIQEQVVQLEKAGKVRYIDSIVFGKQLVVFIGHKKYKNKKVN